MSVRPRLPRARALRLAALLLPVAAAFLPHARAEAQLPGLGGLRRKIEQKVIGEQSKGPALPAAFANPRYEITAERLDGLLRGGEKADAMIARREADERARVAREAKAEREAFQRQQVLQAANDRRTAAMKPYMDCLMASQMAYNALPADDPKKQRVNALMQRMQAMGADVQRRRASGQPLDTMALAQKFVAVNDSIATIMGGRGCPQPPAGAMMLGAVEQETVNATMAAARNPMAMVPAAPSAEAEENAPDAIIRREAQVDERQQGVMCDKIIAWVGAAKSGVVPAGFSAGEGELLKARMEQLLRRPKSLCPVYE